MEKLTKTLSRDAHEIEARKREYNAKSHVLVKAIDVANRGRTQSMTRKDYEKIQGRVIKAKTEVDSAEIDYKCAIDKSIVTQNEWEATIAEVAQHVQELEKERIEIETQLLSKVTTIERDLIICMKHEGLKRVKASIDDLNTNDILDFYLNKHSTGTERAKRHEFTPYVATEADVSPRRIDTMASMTSFGHLFESKASIQVSDCDVSRKVSVSSEATQDSGVSAKSAESNTAEASNQSAKTAIVESMDSGLADVVDPPSPGICNSTFFGLTPDLSEWQQHKRNETIESLHLSPETKALIEAKRLAFMRKTVRMQGWLKLSFSPGDSTASWTPIWGLIEDGFFWLFENCQEENAREKIPQFLLTLSKSTLVNQSSLDASSDPLQFTLLAEGKTWSFLSNSVEDLKCWTNIIEKYIAIASSTSILAASYETEAPDPQQQTILDKSALTLLLDDTVSRPLLSVFHSKPMGSWQQSSSSHEIEQPRGESLEPLSPVSEQSVLPDEIMERRLSGSRSHVSNLARYVPSRLLQLPDTSNPYDPETNMRVMDRLYNASFYDFVRNEENVMLIARHLLPMMKEYDMGLCVNAMRWMVDGWCLESVAKLLKLVTRDWSPETCGLFLNLFTAGWNVSEIDPTFLTAEQSMRSGRLSKITFDGRVLKDILHDVSGIKWPQLGRTAKNAQMKLIAIMTAGEEPETSAAFIKSLTLTENWTAGKVTELVSFLDAVLEWDENYFRDFTQVYIELVNQRVDSAEASGTHKKPSTGKISFEYLAALYKTNLAMANYKLALADFKLSVASRALGDELASPTEDAKSDPDNSGIIFPPERPTRRDDIRLSTSVDLAMMAAEDNPDLADILPGSPESYTSLAQEYQVWPEVEEEDVDEEEGEAGMLVDVHPWPDSAIAQEEDPSGNLLMQLYSWSVARRPSDAAVELSPLPPLDDCLDGEDDHE